MYCLSCCHYITKASLTDSTSSSSSSYSQKNNCSKPPIPKTKPTKIPRKNQQQMHSPTQKQHQKQLSIIQIERAIGAGTFRDTEPKDLDEEKITYNGVLPDLSGVFEGPVEKQIRETGEWFATNTEKRLQSSRKGILMVFFKWILPIWTLSLLVASGVIKLPFSIPFLDDLIM